MTQRTQIPKQSGRPRIKPSPAMRQRLLSSNARRCCVCKDAEVGLVLHHIDGDPTSTNDANIAVLCVSDHDRHHRSRPGNSARHMELGEEGISKHKRSWEAFVAEARSEHPRVLATVVGYGDEDYLHSIELVMQWPDRIEYKKVYHFRMGDMDHLTDEILKEVDEVGGKNMQMAVFSKPQPDDYCTSCKQGLSSVVGRGVSVRMTDPRWLTESVFGIFIDVEQPLIDVWIGFKGKMVFESWLHLCAGTHIHIHTSEGDIRVPLGKRPSVRSQVAKVVETMISDWAPAVVQMRTGTPERQQALSKLILPDCWEGRPRPA